MEIKTSLQQRIFSARSGGLKGREAEEMQEFAAKNGTYFDPNHWTEPWSSFARRDFGVTAGANLIGTSHDTLNPIDVLQPVVGAIQLGANVLGNQVADISLPKIATGVSRAWLANDFTAITPADPVYGAVNGSPKLGGTMNIFSHQIKKQADPEEALRRHLVAGIGALIDAAVFGGSGTSGEPEGIANNSGVDTQAGAALAWSGVLDMIEACELANGTPTGWVGTPAVAKILRNRVKFASTASPIWEGGMIAGVRAISTTNCPAASLIVGDFRTIVIAVWGPGVEIAIDPSTYFSSGKIQIRATIQCDVLLQSPEAFSVASSVT